MCKIPASRIVFSGDSAGANLALALMRYLRDEGAKLPTPLEMPAASVLLSPWCDLSESHHGVGKSGDINANSDYVDAHFGNKGIEGLLRGHSRTSESGLTDDCKPDLNTDLPWRAAPASAIQSVHQSWIPL